MMFIVMDYQAQCVKFLFAVFCCFLNGKHRHYGSVTDGENI